MYFEDEAVRSQENRICLERNFMQFADHDSRLNNQAGLYKGLALQAYTGRSPGSPVITISRFPKQF